MQSRLFLWLRLPLKDLADAIQWRSLQEASHTRQLALPEMISTALGFLRSY